MSLTYAFINKCELAQTGTKDPVAFTARPLGICLHAELDFIVVHADAGLRQATLRWRVDHIQPRWGVLRQERGEVRPRTH